MNRTRILSSFAGLLALFAILQANAYPGESIVLDPATGDYLITYWDDNEEYSDGSPRQPQLMTTTFVPATKIVPEIRSHFHLRGSQLIAYRYSVSNGKDARQSIVSLHLEKIGGILKEQVVPFESGTESELEQAFFANILAVDAPEYWMGTIVRPTSRIAWSADEFDMDGIRAGKSLSGFGMSSLALPGMSEARIRGEGRIFGYTGGGPAMDSAIREELQRLRNNNFVSRPAAVPAIVVPEPFDAAIVLDRIRDEVRAWPQKQLLDPAYAAQLDRYLGAAADAFRMNNAKAGQGHILTLRQMLSKEHRDLEHDEGDKGDMEERKPASRSSIARLAARVLDFNLRYVTIRINKGKPEN